jgi:signal peptidase I
MFGRGTTKGELEARELPDEDRFTLGEFVRMVACLVVLAFLIRTFVMETFRVPSESMDPTIQVGEAMTGEKVSRLWRETQAGDVVFFDDPRGSGDILVKRVIAVAGQTVDLRDGKVLVDGVALDEPYVQGRPSYPLDMHGENLDGPIAYPYTVPDGCIWVMGDNRTNSLDSRYFGPVELSAVSSRALFIYWPLTAVRMI